MIYHVHRDRRRAIECLEGMVAHYAKACNPPQDDALDYFYRTRLFQSEGELDALRNYKEPVS